MLGYVTIEFLYRPNAMGLAVHLAKYNPLPVSDVEVDLIAKLEIKRCGNDDKTILTNKVR